MQPRNSGSCASQNPPGFRGNRKVWKHSWEFLEFLSLFFEIPGCIFPLFHLLGWGNLGILGFLELDFREKGGASVDLCWENLDLGKAGERFGSGGNFWGSFPFFPPHSQSLWILSIGKLGLESLGLIPA